MKIRSGAALITVGIILLIPIYWMIKGSFENLTGFLIMPPQAIPLNPTLDNYKLAITNTPFVRWAGNTGVLLLMAITATVFVNATAAYGLHMLRKAPKIKAAAILFVFFTMALPPCLFVIPHYIMLAKAGFGGTRLAVMAPGVYTPGLVLIAERYLRKLPDSYQDAGRIDGAKEWQLFFKIVVPYMGPVLALMAIAGGFWSLQNFMWQFIQLKKMMTQTLLVGLVTQAILSSQLYLGQNPIGMHLVNGTILFIPMLTIFIIFRKLILSNTAQGGLNE